MAGQWRPKHKCECPACGWKGIRTDYTLASRPCPRCGHWNPQRADDPTRYHCRVCKGTGTIGKPGWTAYHCFKCKGTGYVLPRVPVKATQ